MSGPVDIEAFLPDLLASEEVKSIIWKEYGKKKAPKKWEAFQRGEELSDLFDTLSDHRFDDPNNMVDALEGAAPYNDTFQIDIWRLGPAYFIRANEFDDIGYFRSAEEATSHASMEFSSFIEELAERRREQEEDGSNWQDIAEADDDVSQELLEWAGLEKIWQKYHLGELESFQDLAEKSDNLLISSEGWGGDSPGLSGAYQTASTDDPERLKRDLRSLVAALIWTNREEIRKFSRCQTGVVKKPIPPRYP